MRLLCITVLFTCHLGAETLADVLARIDKTAAGFRSLSATMQRTEFTAVLNENTQSTGALRLKRSGNQLIGIIDFNAPDVLRIELRNRQVTKYYPKANTAEIYDVSQYGQQLDQFLLIGFGTSSRELKNDYEIKLAGSDALPSGKTSRLELTPKRGKARELLTKIELWIPENEGYAIQEKLHEKSKDYKLIVYSDVKLNPPLEEASLQLQLPPTVKKTYPNK
jgi:outer membrane lipoprotein-sorting protein